MKQEYTEMTRQELTAAIAADYESGGEVEANCAAEDCVTKVIPKPTLATLAKKYGIHPLTVRKHLVTAGVYKTAKTATVLAALKMVQERNLPYDQILPELKNLLSKAGVKGKPMCAQTIYSYLPYDITASQTDAAERKRLQRKREEALARIIDVDSLWQAIIIFEGYPFYTVSGLLFRYKVKGGELFVNCDEITIAESSVRTCYEKAGDSRYV